MFELRGKEFNLSPEEPKNLGEQWYRGLWILTGKLADFVNPKPDVCYTLYYDILGTVMDYFDLWSKSNELQKIKLQLFAEKAILPEEAVKIASDFVQLQPMRGMNVLEIGGPFVQVFHLLGAREAVAIDPLINRWPYEPQTEGYLAILKRFDPDSPPKILKEKSFDLVLSRQLLAYGSGFISPLESSQKETLLIKNFLHGCASFTKQGGLNIHNGDLIEKRYFWERQIGLERLADVPALNTTTVIFRKI